LGAPLQVQQQSWFLLLHLQMLLTQHLAVVEDLAVTHSAACEHNMDDMIAQCTCKWDAMIGECSQALLR
jgi:hypothetical protein